jgi:hypothetical protein
MLIRFVGGPRHGTLQTIHDPPQAAGLRHRGIDKLPDGGYDEYLLVRLHEPDDRGAHALYRYTGRHNPGAGVAPDSS